MRAELAMSVAAYALGERAERVATETRGSPGEAFARQVAMYLAHVAQGMSLGRVGAAFERDRSTVAHACHRIEDRREDGSFDAWIAALEAMLQAAPEPPARGPEDGSVGRLGASL
jgi:hypothetical protein